MAEIVGSRVGDLSHMDRSLKHILDAGSSFIHKTETRSGGGAEVQVSILMPDLFASFAILFPEDTNQEISVV